MSIELFDSNFDFLIKSYAIFNLDDKILEALVFIAPYTILVYFNVYFSFNFPCTYLLKSVLFILFPHLSKNHFREIVVSPSAYPNTIEED